jgi:ariadne-1
LLLLHLIFKRFSLDIVLAKLPNRLFARKPVDRCLMLPVHPSLDCLSLMYDYLFFCFLFAAPEAPKAPISMKSASQIQPDYDRECVDVSQALGVSTACAVALLRSQNFCRERLLERFFEDGDKILKATGVYRRAGHAVPVVKYMQNTCSICYEDDCQMIAMPCGHAFCTDCWTGFIENTISQGPSCVLQTCPQADCKELVTEDELVAALGESSPLLQKFRAYQLRSFVESNPLYRWCPGPGCEKIAAALSQTALEASGSAVQCDACSTQFCLVCGEEPHAPADCKNLALWNEKCRNESETANWVLANTKPCPKCQARIEKNQGCNHMTCQSCRFEFCWICMGSWAEHGAASGMFSSIFFVTIIVIFY